MSGAQRLGPYELRGELGRGAMACVWRAWDLNLEREVAVKEPFFDTNLPQAVLDELGHRFVREGRTQASLSHPGIVTVYAADVWEGRPAIVMELVRGETLATRMRRGRIQPTEALQILDQLLDAVGYAHARGVIHRDIKPDNIFVTLDGRVKLGDFGIAHTGGAGSHATLVGTVLGTPGYMSPEQATGGVVDERSDIFSVGVVAYEMLNGQNPFGSGYDTDATTLLYRIVHEPVPELPPDASAGLQADLRPAIMSALAKDPAQRPQTAAEFATALHGGIAARGGARVAPASADISVFDQARPTGSKAWLPYLVVAGIAVVVLGFILSSALRGGAGGGGGSASSSPSTGTKTQLNAPAAGDSQVTYWLGVSDGKVAVFSSESSDPYQVSDIVVSDLGAAVSADLEQGIDVSSIEEAQAKLSEYAAVAKQNRAQTSEEEGSKQVESYPEPVFPNAYASSWIPGDDITAYYGPYNVIDSNVSTAWNEGVVGPGAGEWVSINADTPQTVRGVAIMNGYPKNEEIYDKNNRPREITIELSDGTSFAATLNDAYREIQKVEFGGIYQTTYIRIYIDSVYEGSEWNDTALCEIQAY